MSNFCSILTRTMLIMAFIVTTGPTEAYADAAPWSTASGPHPAQVPSTADPSFTVAGVTYDFNADDCDPATPGSQSCPNPIQASVDFLSGNAVVSPWFGTGAIPDDGNIYLEAGTYPETVSIDGAAGWNSGANRPAHLGIIGAGSGLSIVDGGFEIANMNRLTLSGISVKDADSSGNVTSISAHDNTGTLELIEIVVVSIDPGTTPTDHIGDGILVRDHAGDIRLTDVNTSNNSETGAWLDNRAGSGLISIQSSTFNMNRAGLIAYSNGDIALSEVNANNNLLAGANVLNCNDIGLVCAGTGNVSVSSSQFSNNNQPGVGTSHSVGLVAESNGDIRLSDVTANTNDNHGALLINYFEGSTGTILIEHSQFTDNGQAELGDGIDLRSRGAIRVVDVTANSNLEHGVDIFNRYGGAIANVHVERGQFDQNGLSGLQVGSNGNVDVVGASINQNSTLAGTSNALDINSSGNIRLSNVTADDNQGWGAKLDNTAGNGAILVTSSEFNRNIGCGLCANASGNITFLRVIASYNAASGANADNCHDIALTCTGTGRIIVNASEFNHNGPVGVPVPHWAGFVAFSNGDILLTNVSANSNNYHGAVIFNYFNGSMGRIVVDHGVFNDNGLGGDLGDGLKPESHGDILLLNVTASRNLEKGVEGFNAFSGSTGEIVVRDSQFRVNSWEGLELGSNKQITISGATIENNRLLGADLESPLRVIVSCSAVLNHRAHIGIRGATPLLSLNGVRFAGNGVDYTDTGRVVIRRSC
jgi:Right handed beta helix region